MVKKPLKAQKVISSEEFVVTLAERIRLRLDINLHVLLKTFCNGT